MVDSQDVVIVGAGPAGCVLSILLARSGYRVALVERQTVLDREFRGPAYQPSAVRIFDEMGILDDVLEIEHSKVDRFAFEKGNKKLIQATFGDLPAPFNYILVVRQAPLLRKLIQIAGQYPNFTYLGGTDAEELLVEDGAVVGIRSTLGDVRGRLVVAADGRFSRLRDQAGIKVNDRPQAFDLVWFDAPEPKGQPLDVGLHLVSSGLMVTLPKEEGMWQVGWLLAKGSYQKLRDKGLDHFREQLATVNSSFANHLTSWDQCALLDVKMSVSSEWARDGLLLIGDAAHVASPIGALGNKLAIEDAALVHPIICRALREGSGVVPRVALDAFQRGRQRDIERNLRIQRIVGRAALTKLRVLAPLIQPFAKKMRNQIALSPTPVHVDRTLFRDPPRRYHLLRVQEVREETPLAKSFVFDVPPHLRHRFSYWAGQFLTFRVLKQGRLLKRCYSMSSCPVADKAPKITVKKVKDGLVSPYLHDDVQVGEKLLVLPPAGLFAMPDAAPHHYLIVAGGSGITPCMSLIRTISQESSDSRISLFYVNRDAANIIFRDELEGFEVTHWLTAEKGRPSVEDLQAFFAQAGELAPEVYLCGPQGLMEQARAALDLPEGHIHEERFLSAIGRQEEPIVAQEPLMVGEGTPGVPTTITVQLDDRVEQVPYTEGETVLDASLKAGLPAPFSCQEGICATCRAQLVEGQVVMDKHEALSKKEADEGFVLTCRAKAFSQRCSIRYQ